MSLQILTVCDFDGYFSILPLVTLISQHLMKEQNVLMSL